MNSIGSWFRQLAFRLRLSLSHFLAGRYGNDKLNIAILCAGLFLSLLSTWMKKPIVNLLLVLLSYGLMIWAISRTLSRNTYRRYQENRRFLQAINRVKDRHNCYFDCPKCRQTVRVPRGKGKISITCPRCHERFVKKT